MAEKFKASAKHIDGGMVEIKLDSKTVVVKPYKDSMLEDWPDLAKKPRKRKKVKNDASGDAESGTG